MALSLDAIDINLESPKKNEDLKENDEDEINYSDKKRCYSVRTKSIVMDDTFHKYKRLNRFDQYLDWINGNYKKQENNSI